MSSVAFKEDNKGNISEVVIKDVVFAYPVIGKNKSPIYDQKDLPKSKQTIFEQTVQIIVDEDTADEITEAFPKTSVKKYLSKDKLLEKVNIEDTSNLPDMKKYFVLKFSQKIQDKEGNYKPAALLPKAFEKVGKKLQEITFTKNVGNGSAGHLVLTTFHSSTYGSFAYPSKLFVTDLVEYVSSRDNAVSKSASDLFGDDIEIEMDETVDEEVFENAEVSDGDHEDDVPFDTEEDEDLY